jgi:hypothetical protein
MMKSGQSTENTGKGLALPGLMVGLLTGLAAYGIVEYWIDGSDNKPFPLTVLFFTITAAATYLLLAERDQFAKAAGGAIAIAALLALPDYFMASILGDETKNLSAFPAVFWFAPSRWLVVYLLVTLVKASLTKGAPPPYTQVFFHGLTLPLITGGASLFAGLALLLLFAWARLLKEMDVNFFNALFQEPWFILPFLGAIGGLSIAMMRGQQAVLGALRFIILLFSRIVMPITALFTLTFLFVIAAKGTGPIFDKPYPGAIMIGLALAGMLIFNGVYQNGEGEPPPAWLRLSTIIALIGFPIYAGLAFYAFWLRVEDYGLSPARVAGLAINGLVAAYSVVCLAGLITELNWRGKRWMPLVGSLNTLMATAWIVVLTAMATPIANPWAISANSQYDRIANGRVPAAEFDFGYLRFELGDYGEAALDRMLGLTGHPEADAIRDGVERARSALNYWDYKNPGDNPSDEETAIGTANSELSDHGPMSLELNPEGATTQPEDLDQEPTPESD